MSASETGPQSALSGSPEDAPADGHRPHAPAAPLFVPSLLYHAVADEPPPGMEAFTVTRRTFSEHVRAIVSSRRTALTASQVAACILGEAEWPANPVAIRFDDGYDDTLASVQELVDAGLGATVYVTAGMVGSRHAISARAVADLAARRGTVEVGAHTVTHPRLDEVPRRRARDEIVRSRNMLEQIAGTRIASFAYPHGAYNRQVRQIVIEAGYLSAGAVKNALPRVDDDVFAIPTWTIDSSTTAARITEVLHGHDVPLSWRHERVRTTAYRCWRRGRRRLGALGRV